MTDLEIHELAERLVTDLGAAGKCIATAESCTGGWIAKALTDVAGSSKAFAYGIVSYSNGAKEALLGVQSATLQQYGAVSEAVVREMAEGVVKLSGADIGVSVSGIAGPDGGSDEKPVGTVWMAWAWRRNASCDIYAEKYSFDGDRRQVRVASVIAALRGAHERLVQYGG